jgi:hypothetical protein
MKYPAAFAILAGRSLRMLPLTLGVAALLNFAGCERSPPPAATPAVNPQIAWTSAALARNPDLEVLATDSTAAVFTVKSKSTGEVRTVRLTDIAAAPVAQLVARTPPAQTQPAAPEPPAAVAQSAPPAPSPAADVAAPPKPEPVPQSSPSAPSATASGGGAPSYTIDRAGGQVKVSGPGVSIVTTGPSAAPAASVSASANAEPVICEGERLLHLDDRTIAATGTAVIARGGCELYITNSRINATGTAIVVEDAVVHIANSTIEGDSASLDAGDHARVLVRSSKFKGMQKRGEHAVIQDQGGNQWR